MSRFITSRILLASAILGAALIACAQWTQWSPHPPIKWRTYKSGQYSNIDKYSTTVMNSLGDLQRYWSQNSNEDGVEVPKDIDWNKERLIAINLGSRMSGGYSVFVKSIERKDNKVVVTFVEKQPAAGSMNTMAITSPWVIVRTDRVAGNLEFQKRIDNGLGGIIVIDTACDCTCKCCKAGKCHGG